MVGICHSAIPTFPGCQRTGERPQSGYRQHLGSRPLHTYNPQASHLMWSHRTETKEGAKPQGMNVRDVKV